MLIDLAQVFWNSVFAQVRERVLKENEGSQQRLQLAEIPNGLRVCRNSPFLEVEQWLDGNIINGQSQSSSSGRTLLATLTITDANQAWLPADPLTKSTALSVSDVADGVLRLFQRSAS